MRLRLVVSEAIRSIQASMSTTVAATLTVLIGMFVLGLTIALGTWVISWSDHVKKELLVKVSFTNASTLLIANTIRLSIFSRRREIEVMKLVGATNWFVRGPFMLEGLVCGLAGSLAAVVLLLVGKTIALPAILGHIDDTKDVNALAF